LKLRVSDLEARPAAQWLRAQNHKTGERGLDLYLRRGGPEREDLATYREYMRKPLRWARHLAV
jgi:hypothetical protein